MILLHTLGVAVIHIGARRVLPSAARAFGTLLYLGVERGHPVPREELEALLYPRYGARAASHGLRQLLYKLRHLGAPVEARDDIVTIAEDEVSDDVSAVLDAPTIDEQALASIAAGILPQYSPDFSPALADWVDLQRARIAQDLRTTLVARIATTRSDGKWRALEPLARACLALDPLNEEATLALAESLALNGQKAGAVKLLDEYLAEIGAYGRDLRVPAHLLRTRISEHVPDPQYRRLGPGPFVGRDAEMAELWRTLQRARRGQPGVVVVHGEAGIGKTRLAAEFTQAAAVDGATCVLVGSSPHDVRRPMGVFMDLVPKLLDSPGGLGVAPESVALLGRLTRPDADTDPVHKHAEPEALFRMIVDAIADLLQAVSSEAALVIVLEDAHWADPSSLDTVQVLARQVTGSPVVFVLTSRVRLFHQRPGEEQDASAAVTTFVAVPPLADADCRSLAAALLASSATPVDDAQVERYVRLAGGSPLYLRTVASDATGRAAQSEVPPSLADLLSARVAELNAPCIQLLAACGILGKHATAGRLQAVLGEPPVAILETLGALHDRSILATVGPAIQPSHPLLADAARQHVGSAAERLLHHRVAVSLEGEAAGLGDPAMLWDCVVHWEACGEPRRALSLLRSCAAQCMQIGKPESAVELLSHAAEIAPAETLPAVLGEEIHAARNADLFTLVRDLVARYRVAMPHASRHDDFELIEIDASRFDGVPLNERAPQLWQCITQPDAPPEHRLRAAGLYLSYAHGWFDKAAADRAYAAVAGIGKARGRKPLLWNYVEMMYNCHFGDMDIAANAAERAASAARSAKDTATKLILSANAAMTLHAAGFEGEALSAEALAYETAVKYGMPTSSLLFAATMASFYLDYGDLDEAGYWDSVATRMSDRARSWDRVLPYFSNKIEFALASGDASSARSWLDRASSECAIVHSPHGRSIYASYEALIDLLDNAIVVDNAAVDRLFVIYEQARSSTSQDTLAEALCAVLDRLGRNDDADALLSQYLATYRRERFPLRSELAQRAKRRSSPE
jgi:DNA-binding SARP family transcriptional activator